MGVATNSVSGTHYVYVTSGSPGLFVVSLDSQRNGTIIGNYTQPNTMYFGVTCRYPFVYIIDGHSRQMEIIDVRVGSAPKLVSRFPPLQAVNDMVTAEDTHGRITALIADGTAGLVIVSVHNVSNPRVIGNVSTPSARYYFFSCSSLTS